MELFSISILSPQDLILSLHSLYSTLDMDIILQAGVDIMIDLFPHSIGGVIFLVDEHNNDLIYSKTLMSSAKLSYTARVLEILPKRFSELYVSRTNDRDNLIVRTVNENKSFESDDLIDFIKGPVPKVIISQLKYISGFKIGLAMPITINNAVVGAALYSRNVREQFTDSEKELLQLMTSQFANAIRNAREYKYLKEKLSNGNAK